MKQTSNNQQFAVRVADDSMLPTIQDGDILLVDPRLPLEDKAIVIAQVKGGIVCRRLVIDNGCKLLVKDNHELHIPHVTDIGEADILGRVATIERWLVEDAEMLGTVVGGYRSFIDNPDTNIRRLTTQRSQ